MANQKESDVRGNSKERKDASTGLQFKQNEAESEFDGKTVREIREILFGKDCHFCGPLQPGKKLVIHKKDGTEHSDRETWDKNSLMNIDVDEWVALYLKEHRYVHWAMKWLRMTWGDINTAFRKNQ